MSDIDILNSIMERFNERGGKMAETVGGLIDKITISNLKLWHLEDEVRRTDVDNDYVVKVKRNIDIMNQQRNDLVEELDDLLGDYIEGKVKPRRYKQAKMYNQKIKPVRTTQGGKRR
jgi:hypothetical protein